MLKVSTTVVCIFVAMASCLLIAADAWRVDCTKFVFAPKCRGISAKRASVALMNENELRTDPIDSVYMADNDIGGGDPFTADLDTDSELRSAPARPLATRKGVAHPADMEQWIHALTEDGRGRLAARLRQQQQQERRRVAASDESQARILSVLRGLMRRYEEDRSMEENKQS